MNHVHANLTPDAASWPWSSTQAHLAHKDVGLVKVEPLLAMAGDWQLSLASVSEDERRLNDIRKHERTGRPLGKEGFVTCLESAIGRNLQKEKPGPQGKQN